MESQKKRNKEGSEVNLIDNLPRSLVLHEIFSRLHNPRDVIVSKSVSKSWNSIISSSSVHQKQSFALILNTHPSRCAATNDTSLLEAWKGFKLNNYLDLDFNSSQVCVLASYRDVLLCMKRLDWDSDSDSLWGRSHYYLVNPVTMQWTRVPDSSRRYAHPPIGLLLGDVSKKRFYVVEMILFQDSAIYFKVFDSKRGRWRRLLVFHPPLPGFRWQWHPTHIQAVNFNGALHWLIRDGPIVAYNPEYEHRNECRFINRSQEMSHAFYGELAVVLETLTVSMGHLRINQVVCYPPLPDHDNHHIVVWTLVDYKESIWKQEKETVYFRDMLSDLPWIQDYMRGYTLTTTTTTYQMEHQLDQNEREYRRLKRICPQPLHCHPENPLLLYLYLPESIVSLDVVTKKLCLITRISQSDKSSSYWDQYAIVTPITLHFDPSLLPDMCSKQQI